MYLFERKQKENPFKKLNWARVLEDVDWGKLMNKDCVRKQFDISKESKKRL